MTGTNMLKQWVCNAYLRILADPRIECSADDKGAKDFAVAEENLYFNSPNCHLAENNVHSGLYLCNIKAPPLHFSYNTGLFQETITPTSSQENCANRLVENYVSLYQTVLSVLVK